MRDWQKKLEAKFTDLVLLGEGATSVVFSGRRRSDGRKCVIKVFLRSFEEAAEGHPLARFERECKALEALDHPNIVKLIEWGAAESFPYLVLEYQAATSLQEFIANRETPLPWPEAVEMMAKIADALSHAHSRKIIHRDIKPANILLLEDGKPVLIDFGLVRSGLMQTYQTATGVILGSPAYMAPELFGAEKASDSTDVYSLTVVLYELLCGKCPFKGNLKELVLSKLKPLKITFSNEVDVPPQLAKLIVGVMTRQADYRDITAEEYRSQLEGCLERGGANEETKKILVAPRKPSLRLVAFLFLLLLFAFCHRMKEPEPNRDKQSLGINETTLRSWAKGLSAQANFPDVKLLQEFCVAITKLHKMARSSRPKKRKELTHLLKEIKAVLPNDTVAQKATEAAVLLQSSRSKGATDKLKSAHSFLRKSFGHFSQEEKLQHLPLVKWFSEQLLSLNQSFEFLEAERSFFFRLPALCSRSECGHAYGKLLFKSSRDVLLTKKFISGDSAKSNGEDIKERAIQSRILFSKFFEVRSLFDKEAEKKLAKIKFGTAPKKLPLGDEVAKTLVASHWRFYWLLSLSEAPLAIRLDFINTCMDVADYSGKKIHYGAFINTGAWGPHLSANECAERSLQQLAWIANIIESDEPMPTKLTAEKTLLLGTHRWFLTLRAVAAAKIKDFDEYVLHRVSEQNPTHHQLLSFKNYYLVGQKAAFVHNKRAAHMALARLEKHAIKNPIRYDAHFWPFELIFKDRFELLLRAGLTLKDLNEIKAVVKLMQKARSQNVGVWQISNLWSSYVYLLALCQKGLSHQINGLDALVKEAYEVTTSEDLRKKFDKHLK